MKVVLHYSAGPLLQAQLAAASVDGLDVTSTPEGDDDALSAAVTDADALLHVLEPIGADLFAAAPRLRLVQKLGVGVNTIDLDAARRRGIAVANLPGVNATAVAELALGLMLAVLRRLPTFDDETRRGAGWPLDPALPDRLGEIAGRTVGLVGYGSIAQRLEAILVAMGATVVHHRRSGGSDSLDLDELLASCDIVSLHLPLTAETTGLLDRRRLGLLGERAVLINTGRGGIVDESALAELLHAGRIGGAGFDVFADEPLPAGSPLAGAPRTVLTPHVGWLTADTLRRCVELGLANCRRLDAGDELEHRVV